MDRTTHQASKGVADQPDKIQSRDATQRNITRPTNECRKKKDGKVLTDVAKEAHDDASTGTSLDFDIEKDLVGDAWPVVPRRIER